MTMRPIAITSSTSVGCVVSGARAIADAPMLNSSTAPTTGFYARGLARLRARL